MSKEKMYLDFGDLKVPLEQEAEHFYLYPESLLDIDHNQYFISLPEYNSVPLTIAPSYTMKRVSGGNTDYWEIFKNRGILRRVHKRPRRFKFVPDDRILPAGFKLQDLTNQRRTVVTDLTGSETEFLDTWESLSIRELLDPNPEDLWQGFTEITLKPTVEELQVPEQDQEELPTRFRITSKMSPEEIEKRRKDN